MITVVEIVTFDWPPASASVTVSRLSRDSGRFGVVERRDCRLGALQVQTDFPRKLAHPLDFKHAPDCLTIVGRLINMVRDNLIEGRLVRYMPFLREGR